MFSITDTLDSTMINWKFLLSVVIEFGPLAAFFIGYEVHGFFFGANLLIAAVVLSVIAGYVRDRRFNAFPFFVGLFVILLGGATVITHNPVWLKLEFTLYNGIFGLALLVGVANGKPLLKYLFDDTFCVTDKGWLMLSLRWGIYLVFVGITNEIVRRVYPTSVWVDYRLTFAVFGLLFALSQAHLTRKERLPHASPWGLRK